MVGRGVVPRGEQVSKTWGDESWPRDALVVGKDDGRSRGNDKRKREIIKKGEKNKKEKEKEKK